MVKAEGFVGLIAIYTVIYVMQIKYVFTHSEMFCNSTLALELSFQNFECSVVLSLNSELFCFPILSRYPPCLCKMIKISFDGFQYAGDCVQITCCVMVFKTGIFLTAHKYFKISCQAVVNFNLKMRIG